MKKQQVISFLIQRIHNHRSDPEFTEGAPVRFNNVEVSQHCQEHVQIDEVLDVLAWLASIEIKFTDGKSNESIKVLKKVDYHQDLGVIEVVCDVNITHLLAYLIT